MKYDTVDIQQETELNWAIHIGIDGHFIQMITWRFIKCHISIPDATVLHTRSAFPIWHLSYIKT